MTADPGETPAGTAGAGTADLTLDAKVAAADVPARAHRPVAWPVPPGLVAPGPQRQQRCPARGPGHRDRRRRLRDHHPRARLPAAEQPRVHLRAEHRVHDPRDRRDDGPAPRGGRPVGRRGRADRRGDRLQAGTAARAGLAVVGRDTRRARYLRRDRRPPGSADRAAQDPVLRRDPGRVPPLLGNPHHHPRRGRLHGEPQHRRCPTRTSSTTWCRG